MFHPLLLRAVLPASLAHDVWFLLGPCDGAPGLGRGSLRHCFVRS
ncbi:hypothetical protein ACFXPQ_30500 [Streptomyces lydicus]